MKKNYPLSKLAFALITSFSLPVEAMYECHDYPGYRYYTEGPALDVLRDHRADWVCAAKRGNDEAGREARRKVHEDILNDMPSGEQAAWTYQRTRKFYCNRAQAERRGRGWTPSPNYRLLPQAAAGAKQPISWKPESVRISRAWDLTGEDRAIIRASKNEYKANETRGDTAANRRLICALEEETGAQAADVKGYMLYLVGLGD
jgi:hypothetical protein